MKQGGECCIPNDVESREVIKRHHINLAVRRPINAPLQLCDEQIEVVS